MDPLILAAAAALVTWPVVTLITYSVGAGPWSLPIGVLAGCVAAWRVGGGGR